jgi:hypothetical protein
VGVVDDDSLAVDVDCDRAVEEELGERDAAVCCQDGLVLDD